MFTALVPGAARFGLELLFMPESGQRVDVTVSLQHDRAAVAAVAAVGAALIDILLVPEAELAVSTLACFDGYGYFINETHLTSDVVLERTS